MEQGNRNTNYRQQSETGSSELIEKRSCPTCGLKLSMDIAVCPNDGTILIASSEIDERLSGSYEFICEIGSGGMGVIYKARHMALNQLVAIKMLHTNRMDENSVRRFQQEAKAVSALDHPSIVRVRDFGVTDAGQPHMVLDYIEGETLSEAIERAAGLPIAASLDIFIQVCDALSHAHQRGVLHRDLKPSNIMLVKRVGSPPLVKIVDFGIAKIADPTNEGMSLTQTGEVFGSPLYMSPEQASGRKLDARSDIYSFGCVMYETLTGAPPFVGGSSIETIFRQLNDKAPTLKEGSLGKEFPRDIEEIVARALAKDPKERFATMDNLKTVLLNCKTGKKQIINPVSEEQIYVQEEKKLNRKVGIAAALTIPIILMLAYFIVVKFTAPPPEKRTKLVGSEATKDNDTKAGEFILDKPMRNGKRINLTDYSVNDNTLAYFDNGPNYEIVDLNGSDVVGPGLCHLAHLNLKELYLEQSKLTNRGLAEIVCMDNLEKLVLGYTKIDDRFMDAQTTPLRSCDLSRLKKLKELRLDKLNLSGASLANVSKLPALQGLYLSAAAFADQDLSSFRPINPDFHYLELARTNITDKGVENLVGAHIRGINLSGTKITETALKSLGRMPTLKRVWLNNCNLSAESVAAFRHDHPRLIVEANSLNQPMRPSMEKQYMKYEDNPVSVPKDSL